MQVNNGLLGSFWETPEEELAYYGMEQKIKQPIQKNQPGLSLTSLKDLLAEPEEMTQWVVDGLLLQGGMCLLAAKPKTGKSTLVRQLALAVALGEEFLGRQTNKGLVIYLALEERRADVRKHFADMGATGEESIKIFAGMTPGNAISEVRKTAETEKPVLLIVDTLARLVRIKDLNDYSQTTSGLQPLLAIAREVGCHVLLLHHAKKGNDKSLDSILGSTGLAGTADTILLMNRYDHYRSLKSVQRIGEDMPETVLDFDPNTRLNTLGVGREEAEIERLKAPIVDFLSTQTDAVRETTVHEKVEGKAAFKKQALRGLVMEGKITRAGTGKRGDPYLYKNAGTLVPEYSGEPENQHPKNDVTSERIKTYSGSQQMTPFENTGNQHFDQDAAIEATAEKVTQTDGVYDLPEGF